MNGAAETQENEDKAAHSQLRKQIINFTTSVASNRNNKNLEASKS